MILFPAIDLKDGHCVRLAQGLMDSAVVYNESPLEQAQTFQAQGFRYLHIVDLNGAVDGESLHGPVVRKIIQNTELPVQLGGGLRTQAQIAAWLEMGVSRVILGTIALQAPDLVMAVARAWPGRVVIGLDAKEGMVATHGWYQTSTVRALDLALKMQDAGVAAFLFTDITRDGMGTGINIEATAALADALVVPVIASGGLRGLEDVQALKTLNHPRIEGVICGRALYTGALDPRQALAVAA